MWKEDWEPYIWEHLDWKWLRNLQSTVYLHRLDILSLRWFFFLIITKTASGSKWLNLIIFHPCLCSDLLGGHLIEIWLLLALKDRKMIILLILLWVSQGPCSSRPLNHCRGYIEINNTFDLNLILHIQRISDCRKEGKTEIFWEKGEPSTKGRHASMYVKLASSPSALYGLGRS